MTYNPVQREPPSKSAEVEVLVILVVLVCVAAAGLFLWFLLEFSRQDFADQPYRPRLGLSELLGFAHTPAARPSGTAETPPAAEQATPGPWAAPPAASPLAASPLAAAPRGYDPASTPTLAMTQVAAPAMSRPPSIAPVVAPAISRSATFIAPAPAAASAPHPFPPAIAPAAAPSPFSPAPPPAWAPRPYPPARVPASVVTPATRRAPAATRAPGPAPAAAWAPAVTLAPAPAPAAAPAPAPAPTGPWKPAAPRPRRDSAKSGGDGADMGLGSRRRDGSLVSRVRRRQATVVEPPEDTAVESGWDGPSVTVISRTRRQDAGHEWTPSPAGAAEAATEWRDPRIEPTPGFGRDLGVASVARRTAVMVGSRAREAIMGYGFPAPQTGAGIPHAGAEPAPGQTVVLVGDDVEAWVRQRLYGGRLPDR